MPSDFEILLKNMNNYDKSGTDGKLKETYYKSLGGGIANTKSIHDWKLACTQ